MGELIYSMGTSFDGYFVDENGEFDWSAPDAELHGLINDCERGATTYLLGRKMYEVMEFWEGDIGDDEPAMVDYQQIWHSADKIVYSRALTEASTARTRIVNEFDPEEVRALKAASDGDLSIGGAELAAEALRAGLVDRIRFYVAPVIIGGGRSALPDGVKLALELVSERRTAAGALILEYRTQL